MENTVDEGYVDGDFVEPNNNVVGFNEYSSKYYKITDILDEMRMGEPIDDYDEVVNDLLHNDVGDEFPELGSCNLSVINEIVPCSNETMSDASNSQINDNNQTIITYSKEETTDTSQDNNSLRQLRYVESYNNLDFVKSPSVQFQYDVNEQLNCEHDIDPYDQPGYFVEIESTELSPIQNSIEFNAQQNPTLGDQYSYDLTTQDKTLEVHNSNDLMYGIIPAETTQIEFNDLLNPTNELSTSAELNCSAELAQVTSEFRADLNSTNLTENIDEIDDIFNPEEVDQISTAINAQANPAEISQNFNSINAEFNPDEFQDQFNTGIETESNEQLDYHNLTYYNTFSTGDYNFEYSSNVPLVTNQDVMYSQRGDEHTYRSLFDFDVSGNEVIPDAQYSREDVAYTSDYLTDFNNEQNKLFYSLDPLDTLDTFGILPNFDNQEYQCGMPFFSEVMHGDNVHNHAQEQRNNDCEYTTKKGYYLREHRTHVNEADACRACDYVRQSSNRTNAHIRNQQ